MHIGVCVYVTCMCVPVYVRIHTNMHIHEEQEIEERVGVCRFTGLGVRPSGLRVGERWARVLGFGVVLSED